MSSHIFALREAADYFVMSYSHWGEVLRHTMLYSLCALKRDGKGVTYLYGMT